MQQLAMADIKWSTNQLCNYPASFAASKMGIHSQHLSLCLGDNCCLWGWSLSEVWEAVVSDSLPIARQTVCPRWADSIVFPITRWVVTITLQPQVSCPSHSLHPLVSCPSHSLHPLVSCPSHSLHPLVSCPSHSLHPLVSCQSQSPSPGGLFCFQFCGAMLNMLNKGTYLSLYPISYVRDSPICVLDCP